MSSFAEPVPYTFISTSKHAQGKMDTGGLMAQHSAASVARAAAAEAEQAWKRAVRRNLCMDMYYDDISVTFPISVSLVTLLSQLFTYLPILSSLFPRFSGDIPTQQLNTSREISSRRHTPVPASTNSAQLSNLPPTHIFKRPQTAFASLTSDPSRRPSFASPATPISSASIPTSAHAHSHAAAASNASPSHPPVPIGSQAPRFTPIAPPLSSADSADRLFRHALSIAAASSSTAATGSGPYSRRPLSAHESSSLANSNPNPNSSSSTPSSTSSDVHSAANAHAPTDPYLTAFTLRSSPFAWKTSYQTACEQSRPTTSSSIASPPHTEQQPLISSSAISPATPSTSLWKTEYQRSCEAVAAATAQQQQSPTLSSSSSSSSSSATNVASLPPPSSLANLSMKSLPAPFSTDMAQARSYMIPRPVDAPHVLLPRNLDKELRLGASSYLSNLPPDEAVNPPARIRLSNAGGGLDVPKYDFFGRPNTAATAMIGQGPVGDGASNSDLNEAAHLHQGGEEHGMMTMPNSNSASSSSSSSFSSHADVYTPASYVPHLYNPNSNLVHSEPQTLPPQIPISISAPAPVPVPTSNSSSSSAFPLSLVMPNSVPGSFSSSSSSSLTSSPYEYVVNANPSLLSPGVARPITPVPPALASSITATAAALSARSSTSASASSSSSSSSSSSDHGHAHVDTFEPSFETTGKADLSGLPPRSYYREREDLLLRHSITPTSSHVKHVHQTHPSPSSLTASSVQYCNNDYPTHISATPVPPVPPATAAAPAPATAGKSSPPAPGVVMPVRVIKDGKITWLSPQALRALQAAGSSATNHDDHSRTGADAATATAAAADREATAAGSRVEVIPSAIAPPTGVMPYFPTFEMRRHVPSERELHQAATPIYAASVPRANTRSASVGALRPSPAFIDGTQNTGAANQPLRTGSVDGTPATSNSTTQQLQLQQPHSLFVSSSSVIGGTPAGDMQRHKSYVLAKRAAAAKVAEKIGGETKAFRVVHAVTRIPQYTPSMKSDVTPASATPLGASSSSSTAAATAAAAAAAVAVSPVNSRPSTSPLSSAGEEGMSLVRVKQVRSANGKVRTLWKSVDSKTASDISRQRWDKLASGIVF